MAELSEETRANRVWVQVEMPAEMYEDELSREYYLEHVTARRAQEIADQRNRLIDSELTRTIFPYKNIVDKFPCNIDEAEFIAVRIWYSTTAR